MTTLKFADTYNMVAFLYKPTECDGFEQIVDFLNAHPINYALTINPTIYTSCIEQFWSNVKVKTINGEAQLHALVDGKKIIITESSVRRDLQLADEEGKGLTIPTDPHHTPTFILPSTQPQKTQKSRKPKRKDIQVPQPSDPTESVADEVIHKELGDSLVRAATTVFSLEIVTRFKSVSKHSNDSLLARGNTLQSDEDRLKLDELMTLFGLTARVESYDNEESLGEDASKQGKIDAIDADEEITLVSVKNIDEEMFDVNVLDGEEVFVAEQEVVVKDVNDEGNVVSTAGDATTISVATTTTTTITTVDDITLAQALMEIKSTKPKEKGDKGKGILIEPVKPMKKKDLIRLDEEVALILQAEFDEEERLAREKVEKEKEANIALIKTWDYIQAKIDVDQQLAEILQAQEQEELSVEEKATLFQ
ncbi:hypothetical protein Tco_0375640 [Tanacetum coccineum]